MTLERWQQIKDVLQKGLELKPEDRVALLEQWCGADPSLRGEVEGLLSGSDEDRAKFLVSDFATLSTTGALGQAGILIGRYHLLQRIGEGGMGEVWLAEQKEPVQRRVALKLIKAGMNTREVISRFESERRALALMDHPAIAKVFDAGSTPEGAPYFVMEYVAGVPITDYCDAHRLRTRERLELFVHVCEGVQHAHQKAIIHRDLKPSNILVTEVDGRPAPKIIDFGVAKALSQRLTVETFFTRMGALVGTPQYMSPEQALTAGEDIDTRSDVYSLGVILYELLAGTPPIDLRQVALDEFLRRLKEEEPQKPSTKVRTQNLATSAELARRRQTETPTLVRQMRGDLDSIALKALEKDRSLRYGSPSDFAADIGRYLRNEAVVAVPPSVAYRARKFARRNRAALATACAFALVLIAAAAISIRQSLRANREAAVAQAVNDFLQNDLLGQASAYNQAKPDPDIKVRTVLDRAAQRIEGKFEKQPAVEAGIRTTIGQSYLDLGLYPEARTQLERAVDLDGRLLGANDPKPLETRARLGRVLVLQGKPKEAEGLLSETVEVQRRVLGPEHPDTLRSADNLALAYYYQGEYAQAETLQSQILEIRRRVQGPEHPETLGSMGNLANVYESEGKYAQAEALDSQTLEVQRRVLGLEHPRTLNSINNLANVYGDDGKYGQAEALHNQILEIQRRVLGPEHPTTLTSIYNLALDDCFQGKYEQAEGLLRQYVETGGRVLGPEHPYILDALSELASTYQRQGKYALAESYAAKALAGRRRTQGAEDPQTMVSAADLALAYISQGKFTESEPFAREAMEGLQKSRPDQWRRFRAESLLGESLAGEKKYAQAEPLLLEGYQEMLARKDRIASPDRYHMELAHHWVVQLYRAWGKPEKAAEWNRK